MNLSKGMRNLLIMFLNNQDIVASWGISNIKIKKNSATFNVTGFKHQGAINIRVITDISYLVNFGNVTIREISIVDIISKIDDYIENTNNYQEEVKKWLSSKKHLPFTK